MTISPVYPALGKWMGEHNPIAAVRVAISEELLAAYECIAKLKADLEECRDYLEEQVDLADGGNRAMQLVLLIDADLNEEAI